MSPKQPLPQSASMLVKLVENMEKENAGLFSCLNENVCQTLMAARFVLSTAIDNEDKQRELLGIGCEYLNVAIDELLHLSTSFWPSAASSFYFTDAIQSLVENLNHNKALTIKWDIRYPIGKRIALSTKLIMCRILQEQLKNIQNHSGGKTVMIRMEMVSKFISMYIADCSENLCAIDQYYTDELKIMKARVRIYDGRFSLTFRSGVGNLLSVHLPV